MRQIYCNAYAPLPYMNRIRSIAMFCVCRDHSIVRALVYDARSPQSNPIVDIRFFGDEICSTVIICYVCNLKYPSGAHEFTPGF